MNDGKAQVLKFGSWGLRFGGKLNACRGQALVPVVLLMFAAVNIGLAVMVVANMSLVNYLTVDDGLRALGATQAAMENAYMRLLRDPSYSGESLMIDGCSCTVSVSGSLAVKTVDGECAYSQAIRRMQATATFDQGVMTVSGEVEI